VPKPEYVHDRVELELLNICSVKVPTKKLPLKIANRFAQTWSAILSDAMGPKGTPQHWISFFRFPTIMLLAPTRGGKRAKSFPQLIQDRLNRWTDEKERETMWWQVLARHDDSKRPTINPDNGYQAEKFAVRALREGDVNKALRSLVSAPIAPDNAETVAKMEALHPSGPNVIPPVVVPPFDNYPEDIVKAALHSFPPAAAGGAFGYLPSLLQTCAQAESFYFLSTLTRFVNLLASGSAPKYLRRFIAGGTSVALLKGEKDIRPLCSGDPIRRLVSKCGCLAERELIASTFQDTNYGVGCPGGTEKIGHSLRDVLTKHKDSNLGLLKIDFSNAFNLVHRQGFVDATSTMFPRLLAWTIWCYECPSMLLFNKNRIIESMAGVQQGDPLGPLLFCAALQDLVLQIGALGPVYNKWYMDDGGIVGTKEQLQLVWDILASQGPALGLYLNPKKCEFSWLKKSCEDACPIVGPGTEKIVHVPTDEIQMLGVPLGSPEFNARFVQHKLNKKTTPMMRKLAQFEDPQAAMYLLRVSLSSVRATHYMRTTPLSDWKQQATEFDQTLVATAEKILGCPLVGHLQTRLSARRGGLGLRSVVEHAPGAHAASWNETKIVSEAWVTPLPVVGLKVQSQKAASQEVDTIKYASILTAAQTISLRCRKHVESINQPHANSWITALPSWTDGREAIMFPKVYLTSTRRLLSLPVALRPYLCPYCKQIADPLGDHATCCGVGGNWIVRHNRIRNLAHKIGSEALLSPVMEKLGLLGPTDPTRRRPGDVTFPIWQDGKGIAIDVAVICPVAPTHIRESNSKEIYSNRKHAKYDRAFLNSPGFNFGVIIMETSGAISEEGTKILKRLFRFASRRLGVTHSAYAARAWARLSCCLQTNVAQNILNSIPSPLLEDDL